MPRRTLRRAAARPDAPARGEPPGDDAGTVGVLVVDDQASRLAAMEAALTGLGDDVELVRVRSGRDALRQLLRRDFAVILLDVHMPIMDGFQTAALVRQRKRSERTPIIFVTAYGPNEAQVTRGYALGAVDYIFAPVLPEVIRAKVGVFLELHRRTAEAQRQSEWLRAEAERRAAASETRLRGLLDRLEVGVFRATADGAVREANRAFLALLGAASPADLSPDVVRRLLGSGEAAEPGPHARDLLLDAPGGNVRWLSVTTTPSGTTTPPGDAAAIDGIVEDITARKQAEQDLRAAHAVLEAQAARLARSNAELQRFARVLSHDLQEPLLTVSTFADLLERRCGSRLDREAREYLGASQEGVRQMQGMIHGLLDFCSLDRASGRLRPTECNSLVDRAVRNLAARIRENGARVTRDDLPVVLADENLLAHLFQNLLANAVKFHREGAAPRVHVGAERRVGEWVLSVRDDGIGVAAAERERLFGVFQRLQGSERYPGSGVGLAICKRIVECHGGRIWFEPAPGGGSLFQFSLPTDRAAVATEAENR
jgi:PAS domain S-box-containing protein